METKRTNGDLEGMDAGELREHGARWIEANGWDEYADVIILRIYGQVGPAMTLRQIVRDLEGDVKFVDAGGRAAHPEES